MEKVVIPYEHNPADLTQIWIAVTNGTPGAGDWRPAYRDTIDGQRVIWVKYNQVPQGNFWVRDRSGVQRLDRSL